MDNDFENERIIDPEEFSSVTPTYNKTERYEAQGSETIKQRLDTNKFLKSTKLTLMNANEITKYETVPGTGERIPKVIYTRIRVGGTKDKPIYARPMANPEGLRKIMHFIQTNIDQHTALAYTTLKSDAGLRYTEVCYAVHTSFVIMLTAYRKKWGMKQDDVTMLMNTIPLKIALHISQSIEHTTGREISGGSSIVEKVGEAKNNSGGFFSKIKDWSKN